MTDYITRDEFHRWINESNKDIKELSKSINSLTLEQRETNTIFRTSVEALSNQYNSLNSDVSSLLKSKLESEAQLTLIKNIFKIGSNCKGLIKLVIFLVLVFTASEGFNDFFHWVKLAIKHSVGI